MQNRQSPQPDADQPHTYQLRIRGKLSPEWSDRFDGLSITWTEDGDTLLCGVVTDQSALHGLLRRVRDLGMPLLSVARIDADTDAR
jgi:hypothetical protein